MNHPLVTLLLLALIAPAMAGKKRPTKRPSDLERGEELYNRHCIACHGPLNDGQGPAATAMVAEIPALQGSVKADDDTVKIVQRGQNAMPGYETSFDRYDSRRVLRFMATLGPDNPSTPDKSEDPDEGEEEADTPEDEAPADDNAPPG